MLDTRVMEPKRCPERRCGGFYPLLSCVGCKKFPCRHLDRAEMAIIEQSPFTRAADSSKLVLRKVPMQYIFQKYDGSFEDAPESFNPDKPDFTMLQDVERVIPFNKVLEKQMRLVAVNADERKAIMAKDQAQEEAPRKSRKRK